MAASPLTRFACLLSLSLVFVPAAMAQAATAPPQPSGTIAPISAAQAPAHTTPLTKSQEFGTANAAAAHCPKSTVVWSTLSKSHNFHTNNSRYYGKTKHGAYLCESDALAAGFHQAKN